MNRRDFLQTGLTFATFCSFPGMGAASRLMATETEKPRENPNWASLDHHASVRASSYSPDPAWGYAPANIFGDDLCSGWQTKEQAAGAWIEVGFPEERSVSEIWVLPHTLPRDILGQDVYTLVYSRAQWFQAPRHVRIGFSDGTSVDAELRQTDYFQIVTLPKATQTASVRITIEGVWQKPGGKESGIGKLRVFPFRHATSFEIETYQMFGVGAGKPVQSATIHLINPNRGTERSELVVSRQGAVLMRTPLDPVPASAVAKRDVWIPAPFEDTAMEFEIVSRAAEFCCKRELSILAYRPTYFEGGTFSFNCTCHNDLGWLNTQAKTADFRSSEIILPALKLLKEYPEFLYTMESTAYLMEFLARHPELRDEMAANMRSRRFSWGASYVQCQEVHVGPEKLARQFYFGRLWLKKTFPGVDTHVYFKTDPPSMTLQMPQILKRAGIKYCMQGRMPYGFYNWEAPDGSILLTYGYHYGDPKRLLDPKGNQGWLSYAEEREEYYSRHELPRTFIYDYTSDYLPPQPALPPYARKQNDSMAEFAEIWNRHFQADPMRQIHPPALQFTSPEIFLDAFTKHPLDIETLRGDWPFAWAYYDEPANREALLLGRTAHNQLLAAERIYAGIALGSGFQNYPAQKFEEAWKAVAWPDHGWGGNHGMLTDAVYRESYARSKAMSDSILNGIGSEMAHRIARAAEAQIPVVVFNPLSWERTDVVECQTEVPRDWANMALRDDTGKEIAYEVVEGYGESGTVKFIFVAEGIPSVGYKTFTLASSSSKPQAPSVLTGDTMENQFLKVSFGSGGIRSLYDKKRQWEVLRTDKFDGGEVLQFTAPGVALEGPEEVTMQDFDKTSNHYFPFQRFEKNSVRATAVREAWFKNFTLRESFHLYEQLDRVDIDVEIVNWDGARSRELRVVFPINLDEARLSYEVPFGTVEIGKNELDFSLLPPDDDTAFSRQNYGGDHALAFREAINWIDASSPNYLSPGCLAASDITVHLFRDETDDSATCPMLQHVLLSTRKSLAWNPEYWYMQAGSHRYRTSLMPHHGDWRTRYREAIGFNYPLACFAGGVKAPAEGGSLPASGNFLQLDPPNLVLTAMKKSEDGDSITVRFYEAEGNACQARIKMPRSIRQAWKTSLIEENEEVLQPLDNGILEFAVGPWEIVTVKVSV